ncbi:MAG: hypothetical protein ACREFW_00050 [Rhizomicrobium sp.]
MWNVLKFPYCYPEDGVVRTRIVPYLHLVEAEEVFDHLRAAYRFDIVLKVKDGRRIRVLGVSLYTSLHEDRAAAEKEVREGNGRLIQEASAIVLDLDDASRGAGDR